MKHTYMHANMQRFCSKLSIIISIVTYSYFISGNKIVTENQIRKVDNTLPSQNQQAYGNYISHYCSLKLTKFCTYGSKFVFAFSVLDENYISHIFSDPEFYATENDGNPPPLQVNHGNRYHQLTHT